MSRAAVTIAKPTTTVRKESRKEKLANILPKHPEIPLYLTPDGEAWLGLPGRDGGVLDHMKMGDARVRDWLSLRYKERWGDFATAEDLKTVQEFMGAYVRERGGTRNVYRRVAPDGDGGGWLDLGPNAVHYTKDGWEVHSKEEKDADGGYICPFFIRPRGFLPLPEPERGGSLAALRRFVNCPTDLADPQQQAQSDTNFVRIVAWLLGALKTGTAGAYPHLIFTSPRGTGKTQTGKRLRALVDPNVAELHDKPQSSRDILRKASKSFVVGFDNLESLSSDISDGLCRLSTGLSDSQRQLYTDDDEIIYSVKGPAILNSKNGSLARAEDLAQRMLGIHLTPLEDRNEEETLLEEEFAQVHAKLLGALLDAAVEAVRNRETVRTQSFKRHRLSDFHVWILAAEPALVRDQTLYWRPGTFATMLEGNQREMTDRALESHPFIDAMLRFLLSNQSGNLTLKGRLLGEGSYHGTVSDLLHDVSEFAFGEGTNTRDVRVGWPQQPQKVTALLESYRPDLLARGFTVEDGPRRKSARTKLFRYVPPDDDETKEAAAAESLLEPPFYCWEALERQERRSLAAGDDKPVSRLSPVKAA